MLNKLTDIIRIIIKNNFMKSKLHILLLASRIKLIYYTEKEVPKEYTDSVNVFIGINRHGHTFPGVILYMERCS